MRRKPDNKIKPLKTNTLLRINDLYSNAKNKTKNTFMNMLTTYFIHDQACNVRYSKTDLPND